MIDLERVHIELDNLNAILSLVIDAMDEDCPMAEAHAQYFATRFVGVYYPALNHIFYALSDLSLRVGEAINKTHT